MIKLTRKLRFAHIASYHGGDSSDGEVDGAGARPGSYAKEDKLSVRASNRTVALQCKLSSWWHAL
jgi:hypothetical protein